MIRDQSQTSLRPLGIRRSHKRLTQRSVLMLELTLQPQSLRSRMDEKFLRETAQSKMNEIGNRMITGCMPRGTIIKGIWGYTTFV